MRHLVLTRMLLRLALCTALAALVSSAQQHAFVPFDASPAGSIFQIAQDRQGALWLAAERGLFRFDGVRTRQVLLGPASEAQSARSVGVTDDGSVWVAAKTGLFRVAGGHVEHLKTGWGLGLSVHGNTVGYAGLVASETFLGHFRMWIGKPGKAGWTFEETPEKVTHWPTFDSAGNLVVSCWPDVCEVPAPRLATESRPKFQRIPYPGALGSGLMLRDRQGCVWSRSTSASAYLCPGQTRITSHLDSLLEQHESIFEDSRGRIWVIDPRAALAFGRPGRMRILDRSKGVPRGIECVFEARDGGFWFGGNGTLFYWAHPDSLEFWTDREGMINATSVLRLPSGETFAAGQALVKLSPDRTRWDKFGDRPEYQDAIHLLPSPSGGILASLWRHTIGEMDRFGRSLRPLPKEKLCGMRIELEGRNEVWLVGNRPLRIGLHPGAFRVRLIDYVTPSNGEEDMERDRQGRIWFCSEAGLARQEDGDRFRTWSTKDGLLENSCRSIALAANGDVWYGYNQMEAFSRLRFDPSGRPEIRHFQKRDGFGGVNYLDFDRRGWLWRGFELHQISDGVHVEPDDWITLGSTDGIAPGSNEQGFYQDPDGSVWFSSADQLYHFTPPPDLFTRKVTPGVFLSGAPAAELPKGASARFDFGSLYFEFRNQLRWRYRLNPDQPWTVTREPGASFDKLRPGSYTFELSARVLPAGDWTPPVVHTFQVVTPFWQSPQAGGLAAGTILSALGLSWFVQRRRRSLYLRHKQAFLQALESGGESAAPEVRRLLKLARTPTHLPDLSPWAGGFDSSEMPLEVGGRFDLRGTVAAGGFATVYHALDRQRDGARSAVKIFHLSGHDRQWMLKRFENEIESLKRIHHPNVVPFLAAGETAAGEPYLAMDYVEGETLRTALARGPFGREQTRDLVLQLGEALSAIHAQRVFHRDIKPENLMLTPEGRLIVIDFSIAIAKDPRATQHALSRAAGSLLYMAPEQVFGFATPATDIYSFALVVFEMLTGKRAGELGLGAASGSLPDEILRTLGELCPDLPASAVLAEALVLELKLRPQDASQFARSLADWLSPQP